MEPHKSSSHYWHKINDNIHTFLQYTVDFQVRIYNNVMTVNAFVTKTSTFELGGKYGQQIHKLDRDQCELAEV